MAPIITMAEALNTPSMPNEAAQLLLLLNWFSPAFPIGSFAYSHGLEWEITAGNLRNPHEIEQWLADLLTSGSALIDAILLCRCWHEDLAKVNEQALALCGSRERYEETTDLGQNFAKAVAIWQGEDKSLSPIAYPVAVGRACFTAGIPAETAALAFLQSFVSALVSVAVRLVPLGQSAGLAIIGNLTPLIMAQAQTAATTDLALIGNSCIAAEIAAMKHETLSPRIFRT